MKIKCHSQYNHFPNYGTDGECDLELWNDGKIWKYIEENHKRGSALLIEPRPLQPLTYQLVENHYERFDNIFTHDTQLLSLLPNARPIVYWRDYEINDEPKTKDISFICGNKDMCIAHKMRMKLAEALQDEVDVLGDWKGGERVSTHDAYAPYKFTIVIENHIDDFWFTEKILNAFANKTIPIYFGARKISDYFDKFGIIQVSHIYDLIQAVEDVKTIGIDFSYNARSLAIKDNFEKVKKYRDFEDWFIKHYGGEDEVINNNSLL